MLLGGAVPPRMPVGAVSADTMSSNDKEWARKYLLDPLTAPEPSQETGPGASLYNPRKAASPVAAQSPPSTSPPAAQNDRIAAQLRGLSLSDDSSSTRLRPDPESYKVLRTAETDKTRARPAGAAAAIPQSIIQSPRSQYASTGSSSPAIPTPPSSASPTQSSFHPSNPYAKFSSSRSVTLGSSSSSSRLSPPDSPPSDRSDDQRRHRRRRPSPTSQSATGGNSRSVTLTASSQPPPKDTAHSSVANARHSRSADRYPPSSSQSRHHRHHSLNQRYPGDMSHRPLDVLKREARVANRSTPINPSGSRSSHRRNISETDVIDSLDSIGPGGAYHHGGPYDATLISRNLDHKFSPVAAVRESNLEAIRATPPEYIQDSLQKRMPLQGTSTVPAGGLDMSGNVMKYEEGADLMREPDAAGGAYKRWDGVQYLPGDLKGKGEPSYTYEKDAKERRRLLGDQKGSNGEYEMQPAGRQRSSSNAPLATATATATVSGSDPRRSNSVGGKRLGDGLKKRIGSIRRRKTPGEEAH